MQITLLSQIQIFLYAIVFGVMLGILYTSFYILRKTFSSNKIQDFVYDLSYFIVCGFLTFIFIFTFNFGEVRIYILFGELLGFSIYYLTIGNITARIINKVIDIIKNTNLKIKRKFILPLYKIFVKYTSKFNSNAYMKAKKLNSLKINLKNKLMLVYNLNIAFKFKIKGNKEDSLRWRYLKNLRKRKMLF